VGDIVPWLVTIAVLAAILRSLTWLGVRARRRGVGREIMGPVDLIYRPHTQLINAEIQVQEKLMASKSSPGDQWTL
jgi:hypothetical protein